jgi:mannosyltransferase
LVHALEPLLQAPSDAAPMGERARARVVAAFSLQAEADAILAVYRDVMGK